MSGMAAGVPRQGGATWVVLQFVLGLRRLGHEVLLVEEVDDLDRCAPYFAALVRGFGLDGALLERSTGRVMGVPRSRLLERADLLLNISGALRDEQLLERADLRVFVDVDPAFTQLWHEVEGIDFGFDRHHRFVTVGSAIGTDSCAVTTCGRSWIATRPPIVLEHWPVATRLVHDAATTVGHWRGYGSIVHDGVQYGQRAHSMRALFGLTDMTSVRFMLALAIDPGERADLASLARHRWGLLDPDRVAGTPACLPRVRAGLLGRARHRQTRLRRLQLRLVQRSQRVLPGLRATGDRPGDGLVTRVADRRRIVQLHHRGGGGRRARAGALRLSPAPAGGP